MSKVMTLGEAREYAKTLDVERDRLYKAHQRAEAEWLSGSRMSDIAHRYLAVIEAMVEGKAPSLLEVEAAACAGMAVGKEE